VYCPLKQSILSPSVQPSFELSSIAKRTSGMIVEFLGFDDKDDYFPVKSLKNKNATRMTIKALDNLCTDWFGMNVQIHGAATLPPPDLFVASESGAKWLRAQYSKNPTKASTVPVIVICQGAASAQCTTAITVPGQTFECIAQPCGPHKLAKALTSCLDRHAIRFTVNDSTLSNVSKLTLQENTPPMSPTLMSPTLLDAPRPHFASALSAPELHYLGSSPVKKVSQQKVLHCLAVDDNPINLRLLRMFIEKLNYRHTLAVNGLEALEIYKASNLPGLPHPTPESTRPPSPTFSLPTQHQGLMSPPLSRPAIAHPDENQLSNHEHLDVILMDINMPILDGLEATRQIRAHERDNGLSPVTIIALTGVASSEAQQEAHVSGVNLFLIKPVRLGDLEVVLKGVV
jgi:CheY-like chemotaxis protein